MKKTQQNALENVWNAITSELASLQDEECSSFSRPVFNHYTDNQEGDYGYHDSRQNRYVKNSICGYPLLFDTACGANVFITEFHRTGENEWLERAEKALKAVEQSLPADGLHELKWDRIGWYFDEQSLFPTTVVVDAYVESYIKLDSEGTLPDKDDFWTAIVEFLEKCRNGRGKFAHYAFDQPSNPSDVQNCSAMGLYLRSLASEHGYAVEDKLGDTARDTAEHIASGQRSDGLWPYRYPDRYQRQLFKYDRLHNLIRHPAAQYLLFNKGNIFHADSAHQLYTLYYAAGSNLASKNPLLKSIKSAWRWVSSHIRRQSQKYSFDFSWEGDPTRRVKFTNKYDTTTYFLIIAVLPLLTELNILTNSQSRDIAHGLSTHVDRQLLDKNSSPSIKPAECSYRIDKMILPAIWQSTALKGHLLATSGFILE